MHSQWQQIFWQLYLGSFEWLQVVRGQAGRSCRLHFSRGNRGAACTNWDNLKALQLSQTKKEVWRGSFLVLKIACILNCLYLLVSIMNYTQMQMRWAETRHTMCYAYLLLLNVCSSGKHQLREEEQRGRSKVQEQRPSPSMYRSWEMQQQSRSKDRTLTSSTA